MTFLSLGNCFDEATEYIKATSLRNVALKGYNNLSYIYMYKRLFYLCLTEFPSMEKTKTSENIISLSNEGLKEP